MAELESVTGLDSGYNACGMLTLCYEPKAKQSLQGLSGCLRGIEIEHEMLSREQCLERVPELNPEVGGGFFTQDHQVDPVKLCQCLRRASRELGVEILDEKVDSLKGKSIQCAGHERIYDDVVIANGAWLSELLDVPVFPVKGEVLHLYSVEEFLSHNLMLQKESLYLANRGGGHYVVGASEKECGFDTKAESKPWLWESACRLLPSLKESKQGPHLVGFRPKLGDGLPILGPWQDVLLAGAHYRNGIQLAPVTAEMTVEYLISRSTPELMRPFLFADKRR